MYWRIQIAAIMYYIIIYLHGSLKRVSPNSYFSGETTFLFVVVNQKLEPTAIVKGTFVRN